MLKFTLKGKVIENQLNQYINLDFICVFWFTKTSSECKDENYGKVIFETLPSHRSVLIHVGSYLRWSHSTRYIYNFTIPETIHDILMHSFISNKRHLSNNYTTTFLWKWFWKREKINGNTCQLTFTIAGLMRNLAPALAAFLASSILRMVPTWRALERFS